MRGQGDIINRARPILNIKPGHINRGARETHATTASDVIASQSISEVGCEREILGLGGEGVID